RIESDQTSWLVDLIHNGITSINTSGTRNTFQLRAFTDIDPCRTNIHAQVTIDTIPFLFRRIFSDLSSRLSPFHIVSNCNRVIVQQHPLQPTIRTDTGTNDLSDKCEYKIEYQSENDNRQETHNMVFNGICKDLEKPINPNILGKDKMEKVKGIRKEKIMF